MADGGTGFDGFDGVIGRTIAESTAGGGRNEAAGTMRKTAT